VLRKSPEAFSVIPFLFRLPRLATEHTDAPSFPGTLPSMPMLLVVPPSPTDFCDCWSPTDSVVSARGLWKSQSPLST
jgi:hypothetical protein